MSFGAFDDALIDSEKVFLVPFIDLNNSFIASPLAPLSFKTSLIVAAAASEIF